MPWDCTNLQIVGDSSLENGLLYLDVDEKVLSMCPGQTYAGDILVISFMLAVAVVCSGQTGVRLLTGQWRCLILLSRSPDRMAIVWYDQRVNATSMMTQGRDHNTRTQGSLQ